MNLREAAQQALEALEFAYGFDIPHLDEHLDALDDLRAALAEPEQKPVAWRYELATAIFESGEYSGWRCTISEKAPCVPENSIRNLQPLYTRPVDDTALLRQAWEALEKMLDDAKHECVTVTHWNDCVDTITALRERLGEKT